MTVEITKEQSSIAKAFDYSEQELAVIQNTVAKGTNKIELAYFINVCKSVGLNPFNKEIWCYKDKRGNLLVFAGRDGFLAKAQKNLSYAGIRSSEVCQNDLIELDIPNGKINHKINPKEDRGEIIGAYAIVFRKAGEPTIEWADFLTYNKGYNTWSSHPAEMIKKVAESHALKKAFGISGLQIEEDFHLKNGIVSNHPNKQDEQLNELKELFIDKSSSIPEQELERLKDIIESKEVNSYTKAIKTLKAI